MLYVVTNPRIGWISKTYRPGMTEGIAAYALAQGLLIDSQEGIRDWESNICRWDGIIADVGESTELENHVLSSGLPAVLMDSDLVVQPDVLRVTIDYRACGALALQELAASENSTLVVLRSSSSPIESESCAGFLEAAEVRGVPVVDFGVPSSPWPPHLLVPAWADSLEKLPGPVAIYIAHPVWGCALIRELNRRGLGIPRNFSLVTIQSDGHSACLPPIPLTTVDPDRWQQGYFAARLLHRQLQLDPIARSHHLIPPLGVTRRNSTNHLPKGDPAVLKVVQLIEERFSTDLKVPDLARLAGVGRRTLEERFRKERQASIHEALAQRRIKEAITLLTRTPLNIQAISSACGYSSVHYFSTAFKRATGQSPAHFRIQSMPESV
jgi:DNA-binding LacI/PurR family transcriptional regulator